MTLRRLKKTKRKRLVKAGFQLETVQDFLELSDEEMALIDLKVRLVEMLKAARQQAGVTQAGLAKILSSSQSRVAKMEAGEADVSLDLICRALFALGVSRQKIGKEIATQRAA